MAQYSTLWAPDRIFFESNLCEDIQREGAHMKINDSNGIGSIVNNRFINVGLRGDATDDCVDLEFGRNVSLRNNDCIGFEGGGVEYNLRRTPINIYTTDDGIYTTEFFGNINWTYLQNYPSACPANTFATEMGDSIICSSVGGLISNVTVIPGNWIGENVFSSFIPRESSGLNTIINSKDNFIINLDSNNNQVSTFTISGNILNSSGTPFFTVDENGDGMISNSFNATILRQNGNVVLDSSDESNLNVNSSSYWDNLNSPSDINAGDITADGTYILSSNESVLNVNSSTWWADVSSFATRWLIKTGNDLDFNESRLNATIDLRSSSDSRWTVDNVWVYNSSGDLSWNTTSGDARYYPKSSDLDLNSNSIFGANVINVTEVNLENLNVINPNAGDAIFINQSGAGSAMYLLQKANDRALEIKADVGGDYTTELFKFYINDPITTTGGLFDIYVDNDASTGNVFRARNDGSGLGILVDVNGDGAGLRIDSESTTNSSIIIDDVPSDKALEMATNDKICMDGSECAVWMRYNGTCIETSNGGCI